MSSHKRTFMVSPTVKGFEKDSVNPVSKFAKISRAANAVAIPGFRGQERVKTV